MNVWMNEWMNEWMNKWMNEWMNELWGTWYRAHPCYTTEQPPTRWSPVHEGRSIPLKFPVPLKVYSAKFVKYNMCQTVRAATVTAVTTFTFRGVDATDRSTGKPVSVRVFRIRSICLGPAAVKIHRDPSSNF